MNKNLIATISLFIVPISGMAIDVYVPSLPAVAAFFKVSSVMAQLSVTIYLIGYALSQVVSGLIVDLAGTRKTTLISMLLFIVLSIGILFAGNLYLMGL